MTETDLGHVAALLAFASAAYSAGSAVAGGCLRRPALVRSAARGVVAAGCLVALMTGALLYALWTHDFTVAYVAEYSNLEMPHLYTLSAPVGVAGSTILKVDAQGAVRLGQSLAVGEYRATPVRLQPGVVPGVGPSWTATVEVAKDGHPVATLTPRLVIFQQNPFQGAQPIGVPALHSTPRQDIYVTLVEPSRDLGSVRLHVLVNPLLWWIWVGGAIVLLGGLVAFTPDARERRASLKIPAAATVGARVTTRRASGQDTDGVRPEAGQPV
jgi:cytochrome c biogenesis factor